jgi:hypothetical protein
MKITNENIKIVENYLHEKELNYIDLKHEVLDHIILDIEEKMSLNISFDVAFETTKLKWNNYFRKSSSFYFGIIYNRPKLVIKKAVKQIKLYFLLYLAAYFLPQLLLKSFRISVGNSTADFVNAFVSSTSIICFFYVLFIGFKVKKSKVKTTYSFILKTQFLGIIFLLIGALFGVFDRQNILSSTFTGFVLAGYAVIFICHHFFKKHEKAINEYQLS